jgi:hypothetical protein
MAFSFNVLRILQQGDLWTEWHYTSHGFATNCRIRRGVFLDGARVFVGGYTRRVSGEIVLS